MRFLVTTFAIALMSGGFASTPAQANEKADNRFIWLQRL